MAFYVKNKDVSKCTVSVIFIFISVLLSICQCFYSTKMCRPNLFNPLTATLKPQSNGPLYSNTVIGTLAIDGWTVAFSTARRGLGGLPLYQMSTANVPTSYYSMWHYNNLCTLNG